MRPLPLSKYTGSKYPIHHNIVYLVFHIINNKDEIWVETFIQNFCILNLPTYEMTRSSVSQQTCLSYSITTLPTKLWLRLSHP